MGAVPVTGSAGLRPAAMNAQAVPRPGAERRGHAPSWMDAIAV
jgi:hypothetical protein